MKKILILNGSLGAGTGNTQEVITLLQKSLQQKSIKPEVIQLKDFLDKKITLPEIKKSLESADAFIFTSGTYWDSWGSPMQYFLEAATEFEASDLFMGKPAGVVITMHSVGGKGILSRLQGVLNTLGMMNPPMSGMVYSLAGKLAEDNDTSFADDFWSLEDLNTITHNLSEALSPAPKYKPWPVDHKDPKRIWIK